MNKHEKIIDQLFMMARDQEPVARARIAAALVYNGKIVSYGYNQSRTSWMQRRFKKNEHAFFVHAEVDAIKNALKVTSADIVSRSTLYVARARTIDKKEVFGMAKPCIGCAECIKWFNVKRVMYTTDQGEIICD
jgi:deoxycytidylate deaminase